MEEKDIENSKVMRVQVREWAEVLVLTPTAVLYHGVENDLWDLRALAAACGTANHHHLVRAYQRPKLCAPIRRRKHVNIHVNTIKTSISKTRREVRNHRNFKK